MIKKCQKCGSPETKKDGFKNGKQRYKCRDCLYIFQNKRRQTKKADLWHSFADRKQTYKEIAGDYSKNPYWVQRRLDSYGVIFPGAEPQSICLCIDATWFGNLLVMVFRSPELKKNL